MKKMKIVTDNKTFIFSNKASWHNNLEKFIIIIDKSKIIYIPINKIEYMETIL